MAYTWWEILFFVIGLLSCISILVVLFLPVGHGPKNFSYSGVVPFVTSPQFIAMIADSLNLPSREGDKIEILNNGDAFLASLLADIDAAQKSINLMVYIWTSGKMSDAVLAHLNKKLKQGVQIRILVDGFGAKVVTRTGEFDTFKSLGGKVGIFHSFSIAPWHLLKNQVRNHRRSIIIDGSIGYVGGMTVSDPWLGNARNPEEYRDLMFRTVGPMVLHIQSAFDELWTSMTGEIISGETFYPALASMDIDIKSGSSCSYISLVSTPSPDTLALQKFLLLSVLGAERSIHITTPYFLPDQSFCEALIKKAKEGVAIQILVPNILNDVRAVYYASRFSYENLLDNGVHIYEYQPTFIHTKSMIIDGAWSVIGSANLDNRSRKINEENVFGVSSAEFAADLEAVFSADLTDAIEINPVEWKNRGPIERAREIFDQKFIKQS
jgi:cardiolipin synthase